MNTPVMPVLRPADAGDLASIEQLLTESSLPLAGVREALPTFVVARAGDDLVGVAGLEVGRDDALLRSVAVRPEWRSRGVGRALVTRVIADAEAKGIRALYLLTTTAEAYFPSFGFQEVPRDSVPREVRQTAEFESACPESATVMCRPCCGAVPEHSVNPGVSPIARESRDTAHPGGSGSLRA
jgi:amino-acid N-acetyltransferase